MEEQQNIKGDKTEKLTSQACRKTQDAHSFSLRRVCLAKRIELQLFSHATNCYPLYWLNNDVISEVISHLRSYRNNHFLYIQYLLGTDSPVKKRTTTTCTSNNNHDLPRSPW